MPESTRIFVRNAREQDLPAVVEIDTEAFAPEGTAETLATFQRRLIAFPNGFVILVAGNEIAGYGCSEKRLEEGEPSIGENPLTTHQPDGRICRITALAVRKHYRGRGYGSLLLDALIETAHLEGCRKVIVETAQAQEFFLKRGFQTVQRRTQRGMSLDAMSLDIKAITRIP